ncbi:MAG: hypothetical protein PHT32_05280 [Candidatus Omnitrophica bacterium]|nr:hypothetical protein [Candidatus Omnitrophota bacterium]
MAIDSAEFLGMVFKGLDERGIPYCVARNYAQLPYVRPGSDVDILVNVKDSAKTERMLIDIAGALDLKVLQIIKRNHVIMYRFYRFSSVNDYFFIQVDILFYAGYRGAIFFKTSDVLAKRIPFKSIYAPRPVHEAVMLLLGELLYKAKIKERYKDFIRKTAAENKKEFIDVLSDATGGKLALDITESAIGGMWPELLGLSRRARHSVCRRSWFRHPVRTAGIFLAICREVTRYRIFPPGIVICILGPDGAGKSSVAQGAFNILKNAFLSDASTILHYRPGWLPSLGALRGKRTEPFDRPWEKRTTPLLSLTRFFYYLIDITAGYYIRVHDAERKNAIVIFERYAYDFLYDPRRYGFDLPKWFIRAFVGLVPAPDLAIYLDASAKAVHERKKELSLEEIEVQAERFKKIAPGIKNLQSVNADGPMEDVLSAVVGCVLERRTAMTAKERGSRYER